MRTPLWAPSTERMQRARITAYMHSLEKDYGRTFCSYHELYSWSVDEPAEFWESIWELAGIRHSESPTDILRSDKIYNSTWFADSRLNFAENLLRYRDHHPAIVSYSEDTEPVRLSYAELFVQVARCTAGLERRGVGPGDRVVGMVANTHHAIIAMLATTALGAVWSSCSPDFGFEGILDRFGQIKPKLLFAVNAYRYNGRVYDLADRITHVADEIPSIETIVTISQVEGVEPPALNQVLPWRALLHCPADDIDFYQGEFDHPVYIMYSSGTTGKPKCIVHGAGGTLLQHAKEHILHTDLSRDDTVTYFTTCGWMMWNWLVSALAVGAKVVLYDGSPSYPSLDSLWGMAESESVSVFGTSPKFLSACEDRRLVVGKDHDLSALKTILSTGAPLSDANFSYVYGSVKPDLLLASISGGTDIVSCFMLGCPILPVYSGEIQCRGLGMKVETYDDRGEVVTDQVGELVCTAPFPSRPIYFWDDPDGSRYHKAYFEHFPEVWRHGDFIKIGPDGGVVVYGRSDATLNPGGVRIGTAEIYGPVEEMPEIADCLAVGQRWDNDIRVILFVVMAEGFSLDDSMKRAIKGQIRRERTPRHVPAKIIAVPAIPHTLNGKKVEMAVTKLIHGQEVGNRDALANPEALDYYLNLPELQH